jgi:predicted nucleotidyltransferase
MHSDIDLFIEGLFEERSYFKILNEVEEIARPYKVSIVTDKEAADSLKNTVIKEGRELQ